MTRPRQKLTRCPAVCGGVRCVRPAGHNDQHWSRQPRIEWRDEPAPESARAAVVQSVAEAWLDRNWTTTPRDVKVARFALLLAADAALTPAELRELAGRLKP